uniref:Alpha-MPP n=1 Tax=Peronospora matthiolae TaxID=2874970 RepID=A0AAV1TDA0_9STRA
MLSSLRSLEPLRRAALLAARATLRRAAPSLCTLKTQVPVRALSQARAPTRSVDPAGILRPDVFPPIKSQLALDQELPGLPTLKPASQLKAPETKISLLPSGLRVISHETYGQAATLGLFIDAGSRDECDESVGVTHLLEHLGFKSTTLRSHAELVREVEDIGALTTSSSGREQIIYTIDLLRDNVEKGLELLADAILNVELLPEEMESIKAVMRIQTEELMENPQAMLQEFIHAAAYGVDKPLGRPLQCPLHKIDALTVDKVQKFRAEHFVAHKMVLAGSGVDHARLVKHAEKLFANVSVAISDTQMTTPVKRKVVEPVVYTGGLYPLSKPESEFSYAALAFPTGGWHDEDLVPICVLHTLLGGGDSFSAGGPGKGMYSRLYTSVLNRFYWVESAFAFSSIHADVGLLGIYGACIPSHTSNLVALLCNQMLGVAKQPVDAIELARAKNQLKSSVLMNLESRMILYEDIGRQLLTYGMRETPESVCVKIDRVTAADIQRVVREAMKHPPSLVYSGDIPRFPQYHQVVAGIQEGLSESAV